MADLFKLDPLPYAYDALEPFIDKETMMLHHDKHHQTYVDKLNAALGGEKSLVGKTLEELLSNLDVVPEKIRTAVRNHGGGHFNHSFFWRTLKKDVTFEGEIKKAIEEKFDSLEKFQELFKAAALGVFGSGWSWLVDNNGSLEIITTANQDSPLGLNKKPILALDVWEHAYYLKYQNRRADYIDAFMRIINWEQINIHFKK